MTTLWRKPPFFFHSWPCRVSNVPKPQNLSRFGCSQWKCSQSHTRGLMNMRHVWSECQHTFTVSFHALLISGGLQVSNDEEDGGVYLYQMKNTPSVLETWAPGAAARTFRDQRYFLATRITANHPFLRPRGGCRWLRPSAEMTNGEWGEAMVPLRFVPLTSHTLHRAILGVIFVIECRWCRFLQQREGRLGGDWSSGACWRE